MTWYRHNSGQVTECQISAHDVPVVVIDPEDIPVARGTLAPTWLRNLARELRCDPETVSTSLEGVLTFLADRIEEAAPPPRPEEPTGLGAVVEDAEGRRWVRTDVCRGRGANSWASDDGSHDYERVGAVRVLSEGVTP